MIGAIGDHVITDHNPLYNHDNNVDSARSPQLYQCIDFAIFMFRCYS